MANDIDFKKGTKANLPTLNQGEPAYCTDTDEVFIGDGVTNHEFVMHDLFDAQSIIAAVTDDTPVKLAVAEQTLVGRITSGNIDDLSAAQVNTLLATVIKSTLTTKGDIYAASAASTPARLGVGANGTVPTADSGEATGIKWAAIIPDVCQGRLTLTTATPITISDVTAAATIYFTPYKGDKVALFDGTNWIVHTFTERSLSLSGYTADKNYDIWIYDNAGTLTLESTVWTNDSTRATALVFQDGVYCKTGALTRRYLGTIRTTATTGQTEDSVTKRYVSNLYNQVEREFAKDNQVNNNYNSTTRRYYGGVSTNRVDFVLGVGAAVFGTVSVYCNGGADGQPSEGGLALDDDSTFALTQEFGFFGNYNAEYVAGGGGGLKTIAAGYHFLAMYQVGNATPSNFSYEACNGYVWG